MDSRSQADWNDRQSRRLIGQWEADSVQWVWRSRGIVGDGAVMRGARLLHPTDTLPQDARSADWLVTMAARSTSSSSNSSLSTHPTLVLSGLLITASDRLRQKLRYNISFSMPVPQLMSRTYVTSLRLRRPTWCIHD